MYRSCPKNSSEMAGGSCLSCTENGEMKSAGGSKDKLGRYVDSYVIAKRGVL